jgi:hypothetical protein
MKHQWILGLILTVGGAGLHAQQYPVRMIFTGSAAYLAPQMSGHAPWRATEDETAPIRSSRAYCSSTSVVGGLKFIVG